MQVTDEYCTIFTTKDFLGPVADSLIQKMIELDRVTNQSKASLTGFAAGGGRSAAAAANQVNALTASLGSLGAQLGQVNTQLGPMPGLTGSVGSSFTTMRLAMMGVREVVGVIEALGDGLRKAEELTEKLAEKNGLLRDSLRELANLKGHEGPDDEIVGGSLELALTAGMTPKEAGDFITQFEGSVPAGRQAGHIGTAAMTDVQKKDLERQMAEHGAAFGTRVGVNASTAGDLSGVISQYTQVNKIEDFTGQLNAMAYGLNEGRGQLTPLIRGELAAAASSVAQPEGRGRVKDLAELGAWIGVASTIAKTAGSSSTKYSQASEALNHVGDDAGAYLASIGADKGTDLEKLRLVRADIKKNAIDKGIDEKNYLSENGFGSKEQRNSLVGMTRNLDVLEQRIANARAKAADGASVIEMNRRFLEDTQAGRRRKAKAATAVSEYQLGREKESITVARENAVSRLRARGEIDTPATTAEDEGADATVFARIDRQFGGQTSREKRIDREVNRALEEQAAKVGIKRDPYAQRRRGDAGGRALVDEYNRVAPQIEAKGGDPTGGTGLVLAELKKANALAEEANKLAQERLKQANQPGPPPPPIPVGAVVPGRR